MLISPKEEFYLWTREANEFGTGLGEVLEVRPSSHRKLGTLEFLEAVGLPDITPVPDSAPSPIGPPSL